MFGLGKSVTLALVGWLWADILLGLFVIFLAAASPPVPAVAKTGPSLEPNAIELSIPVDGARLLGTDETAIAEVQDRFTQEVQRQLAAKGETRRVAIVFAYGSHEDPALGQELAKRATEQLVTGQFTGAAIKSLHDIVPGDRGTAVALEIYVYR